MVTQLAIIVLVPVCWVLVAKLWKFRPPKFPYPPGPPETSIIAGNLSDVPRMFPWLTYTEWRKKHGDIIHLRIFGQHIVILNSHETVRDLLEQRANNYSDRPRMEIFRLMGWDFNVGLMPYGNEWRIHRRVIQQNFRPDASLAYRPTQTRKVNDLLHGLLTSPKDFREHVKTVASAIIMSTMYGYHVSPINDHFVDIAERATARLGEAGLPGALLVNAMPILRFLPEWFPGAGFQRRARETKILTDQMQNEPLKFIEQNMAAGKGVPCMASKLLETCSDKETHDIIKRCVATAYAGGADTTVSALLTFFYAMTMYPDVQRKARQELDAVLCGERLPDYDDHKSLPYIEAVFREVMRWRPVLPLGGPHSALEDDEYKGYFIPKGAILLANIWAMAHDERTYTSPEVFNPDRFFDEKGGLNDDNTPLAFGFGRRICVGRHTSAVTIWLVIATVLATFDLLNKKDAEGNDIPLNGEYTDSGISHPLFNECLIVPRSEDAIRLIKEAVASKA